MVNDVSKSHWYRVDHKYSRRRISFSKTVERALLARPEFAGLFWRGRARYTGRALRNPTLAGPVSLMACCARCHIPETRRALVSAPGDGD